MEIDFNLIEIQPGDSPYERILVGLENITIFNENMKNGVIHIRRLRLL